MPTVADYVMERLSALGIDHVFGVPGDYSFPIDNAVESSPRLKWVVCSNELNAAYAADGYARRRGAAILSTTYGVGELSALNGVMGSKAHRLPVFHVVGAPSTRIQRRRLVTHHSLGDGSPDPFVAVSASAAGVSVQLTPDNAVQEMDRVIREAFRLSQPAYILIPEDLALMPVRGLPSARTRSMGRPVPSSDPRELQGAVESILTRLKAARKVVVLPSFHLARYGALGDLRDLLGRSRLPFALTPMDKGLLDESLPGYLGLYNGHRSAPETVASVVEGADVVLDLGGVIPEDLNMGLWTGALDPSRVITVGPEHVDVGGDLFTSIALVDVVRALATRIPARRGTAVVALKRVSLPGVPSDPVSSPTLYPRLERFLRGGDILVAETGTCMLHLSRLRLPVGVGYESQTLWGSIGWATPAALGVALAEPGRRVVMVTGDGAHQFTATELGVMGRYGINPVILVLNNGLYGVEEVISERGHVYDDLAGWDYHRVPEAMRCRGWFCARVATVAELESALERARSHKGACYLEVIIPAEESQPLERSLIDNLYRTKTPAPKPSARKRKAGGSR
ncbi:MAG: alpha-keto acid decarboxylase family protein [Verrucomicrobiota bacterium]